MGVEPRPIELMERLAGLRQRLEVLVRDRMHHNVASVVDLGSLEACVVTLERVLAGERAEVVTAQKLAADEKAGVVVDRAPVVLVRKQQPPVAKPGRGRGWRPRGDGGEDGGAKRGEGAGGGGEASASD